MANINFYKISDIYWRAINLNVINQQFKLNSNVVVFDNDMTFNQYDFLKNNKDITFNNQSGILLTDLNQNTNIFSDNVEPVNNKDLNLIETFLVSNTGWYYNVDAINHKFVLSPDNAVSLTNKIKINFIDSYISIEDQNGFFLTDRGLGVGNLYFDKVISPPDNSQYFDYLLGDGYISIFRQNTNYSIIVTRDSTTGIQLTQLDTTNQVLPDNVIFKIPSYLDEKSVNTSVMDSFLVRYESNPIYNQKELLISDKNKDYMQNYLGIFPNENYTFDDQNAYFNFYIHGLKNYQTTEYNYKNTPVNRVYNKIFSGTNQNKGLENINLGFSTNTINLEFLPDSDTKFYFSPTSVMTPLSNSGLVEDGAVAGHLPFISDRIYTNYNNIALQISGLNLQPLPHFDNVWLCSWLSGSTTGEKIWLDRYYNSAFYTFDEAMSATTMYYHDKLEPDKPYVYDTPSYTMLLPSYLYQYHHIGLNDNIKYVNNLDYSYKTQKYSNILSITGWMSGGFIDNSTYHNNGLIYDSNPYNFNTTYWNLDGTNYAIFPANESLLENKNLSVSLWVKVDDWSNINGYQIFGNYYNSGFGLINNSRVFAPVVTLINGTTNTIYNLNYSLAEISKTTIPSIYSGSIFNKIQRLSDYSYWVFTSSTTTPYLSALRYAADNELLMSVGIPKTHINQIDQIELNSNERLYLYDNTLKNYVIYDINGNYISYNSVNSNTNRIEIDLYNSLVEVYGNASVIDNNNNLWEVIGNNLYKNKTMYATVGKTQQIACDYYNNIWLILEGDAYLKIDSTGNFSFEKNFSRSILPPDNNCIAPTSIDVENIDYLNEDGQTYSKTKTISVNQNINQTGSIYGQRKRSINFINTPITSYTNTCTLSATQNDQVIIIDYTDNEAYVINQNGEPTIRLNFQSLINAGDGLNFNMSGDFTGYNAIRKYKSISKNFSWNFEISDSSGNNKSARTLNYPVSTLPSGWHHFAFSFDSAAGNAKFFVNSIEVDNEDFTPNYQLYYDYRTSFLLGATTIKNSILNNFLDSKDGYRFIGSVSDLRMYNITLNKQDFEKIYFSSPYAKASSSLNWNMPIGNRNYLEEIKHWFEFQLPGNKSKYFNINLYNLKVDSNVKDSIELAIKNTMSKIVPAHTSLYKINWK